MSDPVLFNAQVIVFIPILRMVEDLILRPRRYISPVLGEPYINRLGWVRTGMSQKGRVNARVYLGRADQSIYPGTCAYKLHTKHPYSSGSLLWRPDHLHPGVLPIHTCLFKGCSGEKRNIYNFSPRWHRTARALFGSHTLRPSQPVSDNHKILIRTRPPTRYALPAAGRCDGV